MVDPGGIMVEHRATDICIELIHHLRMLLPPAPAGAPLAIITDADGRVLEVVTDSPVDVITPRDRR